MAVQIKNITLQNPVAPNLPIAPTEYEQRYQDQFLNVLRLYFNQLTNYLQANSIPASGTTAGRPVQTTKFILQTGQYYFDTTLGRPIWWDGTNWIKADGTIV